MIQAEASAAREHDLPAEDCRAQLARILDSADFDATGREHRFLSYVVEEALSGRGDRIKAYSIAVEVFGRDESFDPQTDPIVRIEAGHLRRALERYYLTSGQADPILITIPKGGYVPVFSLRSPPAVGGASGARCFSEAIAARSGSADWRLAAAGRPCGPSRGRSIWRSGWSDDHGSARARRKSPRCLSRRSTI